MSDAEVPGGPAPVQLSATIEGKGEKGDRGEGGERGEKGDRGDEGERGLRGERGVVPSTVPTAEQLATLIEGIDASNHLVADLRHTLNDQSDALRAARRATDKARSLARGSLLVAAISIIVAGFAVNQSWRTNDVLDQQEQARRERSVASCQQANDFYEKHNQLVAHSQKTWVDARDSANASQALKDFAQAQIDAFESDKIPLRDCTPKGIDLYLSTTTSLNS